VQNNGEYIWKLCVLKTQVNISTSVIIQDMAKKMYFIADMACNGVYTFNLLKTCVFIRKHVWETTHRTSFSVFR